MTLYREPDPARKIRRSRRSVTGDFPSQKNGRLVAFESTLERDLFAALECDNRVASYFEQPCVVSFRSSLLQRRTNHVPDILIEWCDGAYTLGDTKYSNDIAADWPRIREQFRAAHRYAVQNGWRYRIFTEQRIRTVFNQNQVFLRDFQRHELRLEMVDAVLRALDNPETIEKLVRAVPAEEQPDRASLVWSMLYRGLISADLDEPLTMKTIVRAI